MSCLALPLPARCPRCAERTSGPGWSRPWASILREAQLILPHRAGEALDTDEGELWGQAGESHPFFWKKGGEVNKLWLSTRACRHVGGVHAGRGLSRLT